MNGKTKLLITAALALTGALGAGVAQARDVGVQWSVTIGAPYYGVPAPVYTVPAPVYAVPAPVYVRPAPVVWQRDYHPVSRRDRDGDGIPNQRDRYYNPVWDRDGDGIPNQRDRVYNPAWDHDGDGIPNHRDRHVDSRYERPVMYGR